MPFPLAQHAEKRVELKVHFNLFQVGWKVKDTCCQYQITKKLYHVPLADFRLVCSWPSHTSFSQAANSGGWGRGYDAVFSGLNHFSRSDFLWKGNLLLLLWLQCMAPGTSGLRGACALPLVGEGTGTGPARASPHSLVGTPARARRSKQNSATSHFAQVRQLEIRGLPSVRSPGPQRCPQVGQQRAL